MSFTQPDIIVFLGDVINDGSISSDENFYALSHKFKNLFPIPYTSKVFSFISFFFLYKPEIFSNYIYVWTVNSDLVLVFINTWHPFFLKVFYIPGDNDIGGEGNDQVSLKKIERFAEAFNTSDKLDFKFLQLYHVSYVIISYP